MRKLKKIRGRKIETPLQRERAQKEIQELRNRKKITDEKRNKTRKINDQCLHCIYMQIQRDLNNYNDLTKRVTKDRLVDTFQKWWIEPYETHKFSQAVGIASGINWALNHLLSEGFISTEEYNGLMPVITQVNEKSTKIIRHWNPKHSVGKRIWPEVLEFVARFEEMSEKEALRVFQKCLTSSIKEINKS